MGRKPLENRPRFVNGIDTYTVTAKEAKRILRDRMPPQRVRPAWMDDRSLLPKKPPTAA